MGTVVFKKTIVPIHIWQKSNITIQEFSLPPKQFEEHYENKLTKNIRPTDIY